MRRGMLNRLITRFVYVFKPNLLKYLYVWIYECTEYRPCDNIEKQNYFSSRNYNKYESYFQQSFFKLQIIAIELLLLKPICYISICRFCFSIFTHRHPPKKKGWCHCKSVYMRAVGLAMNQRRVNRLPTCLMLRIH